MKMIDLKNISLGMREAGIAGREFIRKEAANFDISRTEKKGLNDFVSYVDKGSEEILVRELRKLLPQAGFITEEGTASSAREKYCWVIDPLDGTTNFIHHLPPYAVSIGLLEDNEPVAGTILDASGTEIFEAWKGGGSWLDGKRIKVSSAASVSESLIATGFPYYDFDRLERFLKTISFFCKNSHGIRRLGSAAIDLAYVACGRFEAFYEYGLHHWDIAAGVILVREAGGIVSDFSGNEKGITGDEIIAAGNHVFADFRKNVSNFMKD